MTTTAPSLAERRKPGLSRTLPFPRHPDSCQACGQTAAGERTLERWRECDEWDKPTRRIVVLCAPCARRLIRPHARLYIALSPNEPHTGTMPLCLECRWRRGCDCANPLARVNGGAGVPLVVRQPIIAFLCPGGETRLWPAAPTWCGGRDPAMPKPELPGPEAAHA